MGAAVTVQVAAANPDRIAGVLLISPWSTLEEESQALIEKVAGRFANVILAPWNWAMNLDPWDSVATVAGLPVDIPLAVVSPTQDEIIPSSEHRQVHDASVATTKAF